MRCFANGKPDENHRRAAREHAQLSREHRELAAFGSIPVQNTLAPSGSDARDEAHFAASFDRAPRRPRSANAQPMAERAQDTRTGMFIFVQGCSSAPKTPGRQAQTQLSKVPSGCGVGADRGPNGDCLQTNLKTKTRDALESIRANL